MKKITLVALAGLMSLGSCQNIVDIDPIAEQPDADVLRRFENVEGIMLNGYERLQNNDFTANRVIVSEVYADHINPVRLQAGDNQILNQLYNRDADFFNDFGRQIWGTGYAAINRANIVIDAVASGVIEDASAERQRVLAGEAHLLRGMVHFELVRHFGQPFTATVGPAEALGVPVRTQVLTTEQANNPVPRSSVGEVYAAVIADLEVAIAQLPADNGNRFGGWAAKAYLARVFFNQENYQRAFELADDVIENGGFTLGPLGEAESVLAPFRATGNVAKPVGVVFQLTNGPGLGDGSGRFRDFFWQLNPADRPVTLPLTAEIFGRLNGLRRTALTASEGNQNYSLKWQGITPVNVPLIRLAEMYLTRAESRIQIGGDAAAALADLNTIRELNALAPETSTGLSNEQILTRIREERRLELVAEGDRFHELRRLRQDIRGLPFDATRILLKIPDSEVQANPTIVQN